MKIEWFDHWRLGCLLSICEYVDDEVKYANYAKYENVQEMPNMQNMRCVQNLRTKPNLPNLTYQTNPTGPNLPNYTYHSKRKLMVKAADAWVRSAFGNVCSKLQSVPRKSSLWNDCYGPFSSQKTPKKGKIMFRPGSEKNYKKIWLF